MTTVNTQVDWNLLLQRMDLDEQIQTMYMEEYVTPSGLLDEDDNSNDQEDISLEYYLELRR